MNFKSKNKQVKSGLKRFCFYVKIYHVTKIYFPKYVRTFYVVIFYTKLKPKLAITFCKLKKC